MKKYKSVSAEEAVKVIKSGDHVHWFVTEYGAVDLYGKSLQERVKLVISVANPMFQEELEKAAYERFGSHFHYMYKTH